jgi:hypothetical protein
MENNDVMLEDEYARLSREHHRLRMMLEAFAKRAAVSMPQPSVATKRKVSYRRKMWKNSMRCGNLGDCSNAMKMPQRWRRSSRKQEHNTYAIEGAATYFESLPASVKSRGGRWLVCATTALKMLFVGRVARHQKQRALIENVTV